MERFFKYALTVLLLAVAALQCVQVITRYFLQIPVMGLEEVLMYPALWLYMLGSVNASREDTQIRANVLEIFLGTQRAKVVLAIVTESISLAIAVWLTHWAWDFLQYSMRVGKESPTLYIPTIYSDAALFIGLFLMCVWTLFHLVRHCRRLFSENFIDDRGTNHA